MANILVTGASSGIGKEIARVLLKENNVFLSGRRKLNEKNYASFNLTNVNDCMELVKKACEYFDSSIDVLINCAGCYIYKPIENMELSEIDEMINLNFKSAYILSSLVVGQMKKQGWGRIVNIGSISGAVGEGNATLYCATKAALSGLTKALALEVAEFKITVNQINPGWVKTPLVDRSLDEFDKKEVIDVTPQGRFIEPVEVANLCKYLISEDAKGITGQSINLCAGLSIGC